MGKLVTKEQAKGFIADVQEKIVQGKTSKVAHEELIKTYRATFFNHFRLSDIVPSELIPIFLQFSKKFYDTHSVGYNGIMEEIKERVELYSMIDGQVEVREFLKHGEGKTDIYDKENHVGYEKKTGCGDWLRSERSTTLEEVIEEYKRKKTRIMWDYDFTPTDNDMTGKKSVSNKLAQDERKTQQERTKTKKDGTPIVNKQYSIHIHINTTYKALFSYMESYPGGIKTFFKESTRSGIAGVYTWQLQTLKNSKKKIDFLQAFQG